jgi:uncharacterized protein
LPRPLTPGTSVDHLRKEAKRWLKALRDNDPAARDRLARAWPAAPANLVLRDVQRALALEYGFDGWTALKAAVADRQRLSSQPPELTSTLNIFEAIDFDRPDLISETLRRDPAALHRPFGAYLPPDAAASPSHPDPAVTPLEWASALKKVRALRILSNHGAELTAGGHLSRTTDERVAAFLRMACVEGTLGGSQRRYVMHAADRLLRRFPEVATATFETAVVCGDPETVRRRLDEAPALASLPGGPRQWPPLLYLCTARLPAHPASADNAVAIARMLLDRGADPNVYYEGGDETIHYTALASVIGRGEEQAPMHPYARELAALLLERGAEPYDIQVLYNGFGGHASHPLLADDDLVWLLELIYQASLRRGREKDWHDPSWSMLNMGGYGDGAGYLLHSALNGNYLSIARWALEHGATANFPRASGPGSQSLSLYEQAQHLGLDEFAELLARHGAGGTASQPIHIDDVSLFFRAAEFDRVDVVKRLLDRGVSPDVMNKRRARPLHLAAYSGSLKVARLLIERGAEIDPRDDDHGTTPIYWALFGQRWPAVDLLTPYSRDVWALVPAGKLERLDEIIAVDPKLARACWEGGSPLFHLPDDEKVAVKIVRLFLANGADPGFKRQNGATAELIARARGLNAAADLLRVM